jgi:26S proteasome regulatory subunit T4
LPLTNPELFQRVGIKPPKGVLLYGPPGTGKTLLARAVACNLDANFLKVVSSAIVDKYIGESARVIREMFAYAREHQPCVIFMDEIDAIGGRRFSEGTSADREIQRTLMELLNQMDGFDQLGKVKVIMATNRPGTSIICYFVIIIKSNLHPQTSWILLCCDLVVWTERLKFPCPTSKVVLMC